MNPRVLLCKMKRNASLNFLHTHSFVSCSTCSFRYSGKWQLHFHRYCQGTLVSLPSTPMRLYFSSFGSPETENCGPYFFPSELPAPLCTNTHFSLESVCQTFC